MPGDAHRHAHPELRGQGLRLGQVDLLDADEVGIISRNTSAMRGRSATIEALGLVDVVARDGHDHSDPPKSSGQDSAP
jgi:hypothetical protein